MASLVSMVRRKLSVIPCLLVFAATFACSSAGSDAESTAGGGSGGASSGGATVITSTDDSTTSAGASSTSFGSSAGGANTGGSVTSTTTGGVPSDDQLFVPADLPLYKLAGGGDTFTIIALTLHQGPTETSLYAAVKNEGEDTACDANITIEFFDGGDQSLAAWLGPLYVGQHFQRSDDPGTIVACLEPGEIAMTGSAELPDTVVVDELGYAVYRFSYFERNVLPFELIPINSLTLSGIESYATAQGKAFRGTLENGLDLAVENPLVSIFPLNAVGRPLGLATASGTLQVQPGESWAFETSLVNDAGTDFAAFLAASLVSE